MANSWYNRGLHQIANRGIDWINDTIQIMLVDNTYTFNADHDFVDMAGANDPIDAELSGTGYTGGFAGSGRLTLASKAINRDDVNDRTEFDCADLTWTAINAGTANAAIVFRQGTTDDTDAALIAYIDSGFPAITNGTDLTLTVNAEGLLQLQIV